MTKSPLVTIPLLLALPAFALGGDDPIEAELTRLARLCEKKLLPPEECVAERKKIMARFSADLDESAAKPVFFCNYGGESNEPSTEMTDGSSFSEAASAGIAVREILDAAGLVGNFVVRPAPVPNARAQIHGADRFVEYNPTFVENLKLGAKTNWAVYSVLAHEIGHHLQGHTLAKGGSRPDKELEADEYSGFILAKMGATIQDARKALETFGSDTSSGTHPDKNARLAATKRGFENATKQKKDAPAPTSPPVTIETPLPPILPQELQPIPQQQFAYRCVVNGEMVLIDQMNRVLSVPRNGLLLGMRIPSQSPNCLFGMTAPPNGVFCVAPNLFVFFGTPFPVGQCVQCGAAGCP